MNNSEIPTAFISYSHDGKEHEDWVLKLATDLKSHEVDVVFDQWDLRLGTDLRFFMEGGLTNAKLVLCICSDGYNYKVDNGSGGAGYEGMIMTQELLKNAKAEYIVPIVRNCTSINKVPIAFGSKLYIDFSEDDQYFNNYSKLLVRLHGEDLKKKPPLGKNPFRDGIANRIRIKTEIEAISFSSPTMDGHVVFPFDKNNGNYSIGNGEYSFNTRWSRAGNNSIYALGKIGYKQDTIDYPKIDDIITFDFTSTCRLIKSSQIIVILNDYGHVAAIKIGTVKSSMHGSDQDEIEFFYHIYGLN